jgi:hypothetical protein
MCEPASRAEATDEEEVDVLLLLLDPAHGLERFLGALARMIGEGHPLRRDSRVVEGTVHRGHRRARGALAHEREDAIGAALDAECAPSAGPLGTGARSARR